MSAPARSRQKAAPSTTPDVPADPPADQIEGQPVEGVLEDPAPAAEPEPEGAAEPPPEGEQDAPEVEPAGAKSPADVVAEESTKAVAVRPRGALGFDPNQRDLDSRQAAALAAIGIDTSKDPDVGVHIRPFLHMCQVRDLDPYAREAYLIGRGKQGSKKWTMQVAIDGYLKIAGATGRYIGVKKLLWTGPGDDVARDFREVDGVMEPRWWAKWPVSQGNPGAAKAIVSYYDEMGVEREMEAVADWEMYAPWVDLKVPDPSGARWPDGNPKKIVKIGADGKPEQALTDMWAKGAPHMLAKCLPGRTRIQTDRGSLTIAEIVDGRLPVKVRSMDLETGEECWQPVVNYWRNAPTREWVRLWTPNGSKGNKPLRLTPDHPMWTPAGWKDAGDLVAGDLVAVTSPTLSAAQDQIIRGGLLGDGTLAGRRRPSAQPHYAESHSTAQEDYLRWKAANLVNLGAQVTTGTATDGAGGRHPVARMRTRAVAALHPYREQKPDEWLDGLDDLGLAVWFMDDGAIKASNGSTERVSSALHCCGFGTEFADAAVQWFAARHGIAAKVLRREKNPYLVIGVKDTQRLLSILSPYLQRDGVHKRWVAGPVEQGSAAGFVFVPVLRAEAITRANAERRYDIEVEGTHTFVVNNVVVSNCALALCLRRAFPAGMSGMYLHEEMHQADAVERRRVASEQARERRKFVESMRASKRPANVPAAEHAALGEANSVESVLRAPSFPDSPSVIDGEVDGDSADRRPQQLGAIISEAMAKGAPSAGEQPSEPTVIVPTGTPEQRKSWLLDELDLMAEVTGSSANALGRLWVAKARKNLKDFTAEELQPLVASLRPMVVDRIREETNGGQARADAYEQVRDDQCGPTDWLLGLDLMAGASA